MKEKIKKEFKNLCKIYNREGIIGFSPLNEVKFLPIQKEYIKEKLSSFDFFNSITAISIGMFYTREEINSIPDKWVLRGTKADNWNIYSEACRNLNRILNNITKKLAENFDGIAEQATVEGLTQKVKQVNEYYSLCVSHRIFAEQAMLGWRGKSGLIVTSEAGSALRLATIFVPYEIEASNRKLSGCRDCQACLDICPVLKTEKNYQQDCLIRLKNVGLKNEVCGICIRICYEQNRR